MFEKALLKENPFRITPGVTVWAGRHDIKQWLESFIKTQMIVTPSRCAVIYGVWGSGKSHAALYFSSKNVYLKLSKAIKRPPPLFAIVPVPRAGVDVLYREIIYALGWDKIIRGLKKFMEKSRRAEEKIKMIAKGNPDVESTLIGLAKSADQKVRTLLMRYSLGKAKASDLKSLEKERIYLATLLDEIPRMMNLLAAIFNTLTYSDPDIPNPVFSEVFLWLDECEAYLRDMPSRDTVQHLMFYRDIIDLVPSNLTILFNITTPTGGPEGVRSVFAVLGEAIMNRVGNRILDITPFSEEEALDYVVELINHEKYRPQEYKKRCPDEYYPFTKASLKYLIGYISKGKMGLTVRSLNDALSTIVEMAIHQGILKEAGKDRIKVDHIKRMIEELPIT